MIKPLNGYVILEHREPKEEKTELGLTIVRQHYDPNITGTSKVLAVSRCNYNKEGKEIPTELEVGDEVIYDNRAIQILEDNKEKVILIREVDILAKV